MGQIDLKFEFHPAQQQVYANPSPNKVVVAGRGWGKALALDTLLPTPHGWVEMGDVELGTPLYDERGEICHVTAVFDVPRAEAYRVWFSDATWLDACADHQWVVYDHLERKALNREGKKFPEDWAAKPTKTTAELYESQFYGPRGDRRYCIPCAAPLHGLWHDLACDPYVLGYWLGDGSTGDGEVTVGDEDLWWITEHKALGEHHPPRRSNTANVVTIKGLRSALRTLGVLHAKAIPPVYLRARIPERLALLQGLMDSDGHADTSKVEFCSTNRMLAEGVMELARSLGEKPRLLLGTATLNGREIGPKYRVFWRPRLYTPFRLPRKAERITFGTAQGLRNDHRMILEIEPLEAQDMRCVTVDSPNSMYLAGEAMIPTHNSRYAAIDAVLKGLEDENWAGIPLTSESEVMYMAPTFDQAKGIFWPILKMVAEPVTAAVHENTGLLTLVNGVRIRLKGMDNPDRARGFILRHAILDEFADMDPSALSVITAPSVMKTNGTTLLIGTPKKGKPHLGEMLRYAREQPVDPKLGFPRWAGFQYSSRENPWLAEEAIDAISSDMSYERMREEIEAEILAEGGNILDPAWWRFTPREPQDGYFVVSVDLGGFTTGPGRSKELERRDDTAIAIVKIHRGGWWVKEIQYGRWDTRETALRIVKAGVACDAVKVGIEKGALYNAVQPYITDVMSQYGKFRKVEPTTHGNKHKTDRIMSAIEGRLQRGRIQLNCAEELPPRDRPPWINTLISQASDFPSPHSRDDLLDALSYADQLGTTVYSTYEPAKYDPWQPVDELVGF